MGVLYGCTGPDISDFSKCIVKYFPAGYIVHSYAMQPCTLKKEAWIIVEHHGKTPEGLELFLAVTGRRHSSMAYCISELRWYRDGIHE